ncbi:MAG: DUF2807 domain-containing protein [Alphaproteobacteria bacterium]|nr:DUF2807 domain-containing protein [Alphaproteobacteria bacterium]
MRNRIESFVIGAAIAALVILPARAADSDWITGQQQTFNVHALRVNGVVGNLKVDVRDGGPAVLQVNGLRQRVNTLTVHATNGELVIEGHNLNDVWDWHRWFDFSHLGENKSKNLIINVVVPKGTRVKVDDLIGNANIGNTDGPMNFSADGSTETTIGRVSEAKISLAGSGKVTVGDVAGPLKADTAGSGDIRVGAADSVNADIAGSGSIAVGRIAHGVNVDIAGSGDFTAASVNGPTKVDIAGSGSATIADGTADPLNVDIMGSGSLNFGGTAVDPRVSALGSGSVKIKAYRGKLSSDGMANLKIGN